MLCNTYIHIPKMYHYRFNCYVCIYAVEYKIYSSVVPFSSCYSFTLFILLYTYNENLSCLADEFSLIFFSFTFFSRFSFTISLKNLFIMYYKLKLKNSRQKMRLFFLKVIKLN